MLRMRFAQVRSRRERDASHFAQVALHGFAIDNEFGTQRLGNLTRTIERIGGVNLVNAMFDSNLVWRWWLGLVIQTRAIEAEQLALCRERKSAASRSISASRSLRGRFDARFFLEPLQWRGQFAHLGIPFMKLFLVLCLERGIALRLGFKQSVQLA